MTLPTDDHPAKRDRLLKVLADHGADRLLLTSQTALAWYLDGARIHVNLAAPPIVAAVVSADADVIMINSNEADRLTAEELPSWVTVRQIPWDQSVLQAATDALGDGLGPDAGTLVEDDAADALRDARSPLLPRETARFRRLGTETAALLTDLLHQAAPHQVESELAAVVAGGITAIGAEPLVVLVGGESRGQHRHPLATDAPIGRRALVVVCARRHGLVINVSRWVRFGPATAAERDADARILEVEAEFFAGIRPGATLADVFASGCRGYGAHGFDAEEWRRHHQGGIAGYAGRDPRGTATATDPIRIGQAFAWNPSAPGAKVEDTVLLTEAGLEVLTFDPRWPSVEVRGLSRPDVLELPAS